MMGNWIETIVKVAGYLLMSGVVWVLTGICFVIGITGMAISFALRVTAVAIYYLCEEIKNDYQIIRRKATPQLAYLRAFRNDILRECGRGAARDNEDEYWEV